MRALRNNAGFTLIDLLVVFAIIGILAAIAIPQFAIYRQKGFDSRAESDLRNAATAEEIGRASCRERVESAEAAACKRKLPGFNASNGVTMKMTGATTSITCTVT